METKLENENNLVFILNDEACQIETMSDLRALLYYSVYDNKSIFFINTSTLDSCKRIKSITGNNLDFETKEMLYNKYIRSSYLCYKKGLLEKDKIKYQELNVKEIDVFKDFADAKKLLALLDKMPNLTSITLAGTLLETDIANLTILLRRYFKNRNRNAEIIVSLSLVDERDSFLYRDAEKLKDAMARDGIRLDRSLYKWKWVRK